jgi:hypothetical protein
MKIMNPNPLKRGYNNVRQQFPLLFKEGREVVILNKSLKINLIL